MSTKSTTRIHPNAFIVLTIGAFLAVWIAGRHGSITGGVVFLLASLLIAVGVNYLKRK